MKAATGYYSIVQYCPDPMRKEVANIGVVLFCPERDFLEVRMANDDHRIKVVFPKLNADPKQLAMELRFVERRLRIDREHFKTVDDLTRFAETRAAAMRLTLPLPVLVEEPVAELNRLFERVVGEREQRTYNEIQQTLTETFKKNQLTDRVQVKVKVTLPVFRRPMTAPFGFQNGRYNLIQTTKFTGHRMSGILERAGKLALEGELLYGETHPRLGEMQLLVVAQFGADQKDVSSAVHKIFKERHTRLFRIEETEKLVEEIRATAKPLDPSLFDT